jgi:hypothetical protein
MTHSSAISLATALALTACAAPPPSSPTAPIEQPPPPQHDPLIAGLGEAPLPSPTTPTATGPPTERLHTEADDLAPPVPLDPSDPTSVAASWLHDSAELDAEVIESRVVNQAANRATVDVLIDAGATSNATIDIVVITVDLLVDPTNPAGWLVADARLQ